MLKSAYCGLCTVVFAYTLAENVRERPDGIIIASIFIVLLIVSSVASRYQRSTELRVKKCEFVDKESAKIWDSLRESRVNLVSVSTLDPDYRADLRERIKSYYKLKGPITFVYVSLLDDRSDFYEQLRMQIEHDNGDYLVKVSGANVIANTVAYVSIVLRADNVILRLSRERRPLTQVTKYLLFGTGEIGLMVHEILLSYWKGRPQSERPLLFLMTG